MVKVRLFKSLKLWIMNITDLKNKLINRCKSKISWISEVINLFVKCVYNFNFMICVISTLFS